MIERYTLPEVRDIWSEENKFRTWLKIEILACEALAKEGRIPQKDLDIIRERSDFSLKRIKEIEAETHHDVIAFVSSVQERVGESGRFLHMGLTSSDVVDTSLSVLMKQSACVLLKDADLLIDAVKDKARRYKTTPCAGRTHGVHAEPVSLGLKFALMYEDMKRMKQRIIRAKEIISFGKISGAVGTYAHIVPAVEEYVCAKLGLAPAPVSTQILQRDRHAEYISMFALAAGSLERWAVEVRNLQKTEVRELEEPFRGGQKGSSAMPHKKNPVICERICGLSRVLRGYALTAQENIALWHERDISHSSAERVIIPDAVAALHYILFKMLEVIRDMTVYPENMRRNIESTGGLIFSQRVLLALLDKGISRDEAYKIVQDNAMKVHAKKGAFMELLLKDKQVTALLTEREIRNCFDAGYFLRNIDFIFRRLGL